MLAPYWGHNPPSSKQPVAVASSSGGHASSLPALTSPVSGGPGVLLSKDIKSAHCITFPIAAGPGDSMMPSDHRTMEAAVALVLLPIAQLHLLLATHVGCEFPGLSKVRPGCGDEGMMMPESSPSVGAVFRAQWFCDLG